MKCIIIMTSGEQSNPQGRNRASVMDRKGVIDLNGSNCVEPEVLLSVSCQEGNSSRSNELEHLHVTAIEVAVMGLALPNARPNLPSRTTKCPQTDCTPHDN